MNLVRVVPEESGCQHLCSAFQPPKLSALPLPLRFWPSQSQSALARHHEACTSVPVCMQALKEHMRQRNLFVTGNG